jgi:hypothetical protein
MNDSPLGRFFGVVTRPRTWLNLLFHVLAFPLGLFYFVFLVTGLSVGLGLVIVWVGIPILLVVGGAWWLFGAFERLQARVLLGATVPDAPRSWENVEGIWGKVKAHFGNGATWKDLLYLLAKLAFGVVSFTLIVTLWALIAFLFAMPFAAAYDVAMFDWGNGQTFVPPIWLGVLGIPAAVLLFFAALHVMNGWGWVCARWAEVMFRVREAPAAPAGAARPAPLVYTAPQPPAVPPPPAPAVAPIPAPPPVTPPAPPAPAVAPIPAPAPVAASVQSPVASPAPPAAAPGPPETQRPDTSASPDAASPVTEEH